MSTVSRTRLKFVRRSLKLSLQLKRKRLRVLAVLLRAAALGVLRPVDVDAFVAETYASDADFYHPQTRRDTYEERIVDALHELAPGKRLLDAFCGQGREAAIFSRAGFDVLGIDTLEEMIDGARGYAGRESIPAEFQVAQFDTFEDPKSEGFDIVYTSPWMFSTTPTAARRREFLERCKELCKSEGIIVISYEALNTSRIFQNVLLDSTSRLTAIVTFGYRKFQRGDRLGEAGLFWHQFEKKDAIREVEATGLEVVHSDHSADGLLDFLLLKQR